MRNSSFDYKSFYCDIQKVDHVWILQKLRETWIFLSSQIHVGIMTMRLLMSVPLKNGRRLFLLRVVIITMMTSRRGLIRNGERNGGRIIILVMIQSSFLSPSLLIIASWKSFLIFLWLFLGFLNSSENRETPSLTLPLFRFLCIDLLSHDDEQKERK